jgi:hypothetical protein
MYNVARSAPPIFFIAVSSYVGLYQAAIIRRNKRSGATFGSAFQRREHGLHVGQRSAGFRELAGNDDMICETSGYN